MFKLQDDPTVKESETAILKNPTICKKLPIMSLFIAGVLLSFYLLYFFLFYKKELYFISYQMNK